MKHNKLMIYFSIKILNLQYFCIHLHRKCQLVTLSVCFIFEIYFEKFKPFYANIPGYKVNFKTKYIH